MDTKEINEFLLSGEKVNIEFKEAKNSIPKSIYESYSAFANTDGGYIILGVKEYSDAKDLRDKFKVQGVEEAQRLIDDFWNTINGNKVNSNILVDKDVYSIKYNDKDLIVIKVPRADYKIKPIYIGENPYKGTFKRNNEGDYRCTEIEVKAMIRDQNSEGNDSLILEYHTMDDIDSDTLRKYRILFNTWNHEHLWNSLPDKEFLEMLGGYKKDRRRGVEGLTLAGLMMFGTGFAIRDEFANIFMDYRDEVNATIDIRWNDRVTYDGTWENNILNFFFKVVPKLTSDLKKPFKLEGIQRVDDTPVHKAIREAFVNMVIHADYFMEGTLKVIKTNNGFTFTNPGLLKLPLTEIYQGGNSKPRNPKMQTMLRMVGYGDNAGSGFPTIIATWNDEGWTKPRLIENIALNQVTLELELLGREDQGKTTQTTQTTQLIKEQDNQNIELSEREVEILNYIRQNTKVSQRNISENLNLDINTVKYYTTKLKKNNFLERKGNSRSGEWVVKWN